MVIILKDKIRDMETVKRYAEEIQRGIEQTTTKQHMKGKRGIGL